MFDLETAYIILESPNRASVDRYFRDVVGLMPGASPDDATSAWRLDSRVHRVLVRDGSRADAVVMAFETRDDEAFERVLSRVERLGVQVRRADDSTRAQRQVRNLARFETPWGVDVEVCVGLAQAQTPFESAGFPKGFVTEGQGFGHGVFAIGDADAYEAARRLAVEGLGLGLSDWLRMPTPVGEMHVSFLHCNARHHSLALAYRPAPQVPQRLHHINFEVSDVADVGTAMDRAVQSRTPLANTIGQHENDQMVSFYSISPDGWRVEIGATGRTVTESWSDVREYNRISVWGHHDPAAFADLSS